MLVVGDVLRYALVLEFFFVRFTCTPDDVRPHVQSSASSMISDESELPNAYDFDEKNTFKRREFALLCAYRAIPWAIPYGRIFFVAQN